MVNYVPTKQHLREVLLFLFNSKKRAVESHRLLSETYGDHTPPIKMCEYWFRRFKSGDFDTEDKERPGQPKKIEDEELEKPNLNLLLKPNETITSERYRLQLMRLSRALKEKRPEYKQRHDKVILQHDNARPHVAKPVKTYLETLKWEVLPHPLYSPDIAPSDYHLFLSMSNDLSEQCFTSYEETKKWVDSWIASKDESFFRRGIRSCQKDGKK